MAEAVAYLDGNPGPDVPFNFRLGNRVVSTLDGKAGVIVWGRCRYTVGGGADVDVYEVELPNGLHFLARAMEIRLQ